MEHLNPLPATAAVEFVTALELARDIIRASNPGGFAGSRTLDMVIRTARKEAGLPPEGR